VNLTLATNSGNLVKTGSTFAGWNTAANGTGTDYAVGATYTANAAVTLYAKWTTASTYTISYNGNGNTGGTAPANQTKTHGVNLTLATNSGALVKTGSTFAGWNTAANGSGTNYATGATYTANAAVTLYAKWTLNTAPVASNLSVSTSKNTAVSGVLQATDAQSNLLTFSIVANGAKGSAVITNAATGAFTYTPNTNQSGTDTFTFRANDGSSNSNIATVMVTINGTLSISSAPSATPNPANAGDAVQFTVAASGNDPLTYQWAFGDGSDATGATVLHSYSAPGIYAVTVTVSDATVQSATEILQMTVYRPQTRIATRMAMASQIAWTTTMITTVSATKTKSPTKPIQTTRVRCRRRPSIF
jgi:PKD domain/Listeria-Bacteroides repeat domain (List_Bact_rpt)/Bacterial Ig domain